MIDQNLGRPARLLQYSINIQREIFREGWELEGRDAPHVDHVRQRLEREERDADRQEDPRPWDRVTTGDREHPVERIDGEVRVLEPGQQRLHLPVKPRRGGRLETGVRFEGQGGAVELMAGQIKHRPAVGLTET